MWEQCAKNERKSNFWWTKKLVAARENVRQKFCDGAWRCSGVRAEMKRGRCGISRRAFALVLVVGLHLRPALERVAAVGVAGRVVAAAAAQPAHVLGEHEPFAVPICVFDVVRAVVVDARDRSLVPFSFGLVVGLSRERTQSEQCAKA